METETQTIQQPYKFAFHDGVSDTPPNVKMWNEIVAKGGKNLTREEKDGWFHNLMGNSHGTVYRQGGWAFPFKQFLKRYAVKYSHTSGFSEIWAFDKMSIRHSYYTNSDIVEIIEL